MLFSVYLISGFLFIAMVIVYFRYVYIAVRFEYPSVLESVKEHQKICVVVPCYNEMLTIEKTISSILSSRYDRFEIVIVDDGSTDDTLRLLQSILSLCPIRASARGGFIFRRVQRAYRSQRYENVFVLSKINGGKADALNAGIAYSDSDIIVTVDADTGLDFDALSWINFRFSTDNVVAAGGNIVPWRSLTKARAPMIVKLQTLEYARGFLLEKFTLGRLNAISVISGAFGAFKRSVLEDIGGYHKTLGEDIDITLRVHQWIAKHDRDAKMIFIPDALAYTECPMTVKELYRQRVRWQKAFFDALYIHRQWLFHHVRASVSQTVIGTMLILGVIPAFVFYGFIIEAFFFPVSTFSILTFAGISGIVMITQSIASQQITHRFLKSYTFHYFFTMLVEIFLYRFITMTFVVAGSVLYFFNHEDWAVSSRSEVIQHEIREQSL